MPVPKDFRFAILGRIVWTDHLVKELSARGFPVPVVIMSLDIEYARDKVLLARHGLYGNLEGLAARGLAKIYKMNSVNSDEALGVLAEHGCNIGFSMACRNIIKKPVIDFFKGRIFNIHDSHLPDERGGALNTWRILNGINSVGDTIHYLDEGIDTGDVVLQGRAHIEKARPKPVDYLQAEVGICHELLSRFLDLILKSDPVQATPQDNEKSLYFPRLYSEQNGVIDWSWSPEHIERFIRGFSTPYPGAYTYCNGRKIHILDALLDPSMDREFHPFCNGKIVTVMNNRNVRVIAGGRAMILTEISVDGTVCKPAEHLSVKYTLSSPSAEVERARSYVPTTKHMRPPEESQEPEPSRPER